MSKCNLPEIEDCPKFDNSFIDTIKQMRDAVDDLLSGHKYIANETVFNETYSFVGGDQLPLNIEEMLIPIEFPECHDVGLFKTYIRVFFKNPSPDPAGGGITVGVRVGDVVHDIATTPFSTAITGIVQLGDSTHGTAGLTKGKLKVEVYTTDGPNAEGGIILPEGAELTITAVVQLRGYQRGIII